MEKTEAVQKLNKLLETWEGSDLLHKNQCANEILDFLVEEIGMLPPVIKKYENCHFEINSMGLGETAGDYYKWETK